MATAIAVLIMVGVLVAVALLAFYARPAPGVRRRSDFRRADDAQHDAPYDARRAQRAVFDEFGKMGPPPG
jgi:hypothetical protein